jgi:hypothetical protein
MLYNPLPWRENAKNEGKKRDEISHFSHCFILTVALCIHTAVAPREMAAVMSSQKRNDEYIKSLSLLAIRTYKSRRSGSGSNEML